MSPEYAMEGVFSVKSDVFSFRVLVLEIVSGRKNRGMYRHGSGEHSSLLGHVSSQITDPARARACVSGTEHCVADTDRIDGHQTWKLWRDGNALALLDEAVAGAGAFRRSEVLRCVQVGLLCVQERPEDRPDMAAVFLALGNPAAVLPQPRHPGFCSDRGSASTQGECSSTCTVNDLTVTIMEGR
jgi:hypothetical protein